MDESSWLRCKTPEPRVGEVVVFLVVSGDAEWRRLKKPRFSLEVLAGLVSAAGAGSLWLKRGIPGYLAYEDFIGKK